MTGYKRRRRNGKIARIYYRGMMVVEAGRPPQRLGEKAGTTMKSFLLKSRRKVTRIQWQKTGRSEMANLITPSSSSLYNAYSYPILFLFSNFLPLQLANNRARSRRAPVILYLLMARILGKEGIMDGDQVVEQVAIIRATCKTIFLNGRKIYFFLFFFFPRINRSFLVPLILRFLLYSIYNLYRVNERREFNLS